MRFIVKKEDLRPTNDWFFKKIYGRKSSKDITEKFIKAFLDLDIKITNINKQFDLETDDFNEKAGILDILVEASNGEQIDLEIQVGNYQFAPLRLARYACQLFSNGLEKGEIYDKARKTIAVMFIKDDIDVYKIYPEYMLKWKLREEKYHELILTDKLEIVIISLNKLKNSIKAGKLSEKEKVAVWTKFLLNPKTLTREEMEENQEIKKANDIYNELMDNVQEVNRAIRREMFLSDIASIRHEGEQKGIEKGIKEGMQKGIQKIAKKMLEKNKPLDEIIEFTGLTKEEIEALK